MLNTKQLACCEVIQTEAADRLRWC